MIHSDAADDGLIAMCCWNHDGCQAGSWSADTKRLYRYRTTWRRAREGSLPLRGSKIALDGLCQLNDLAFNHEADRRANGVLAQGLGAGTLSGGLAVPGYQPRVSSADSSPPYPATRFRHAIEGPKRVG